MILRVKIRSTTAPYNGLTGLTGSSSGLIIAAICDDEATTTSYTAAGSTIQTIATLGTYAAPTSGDCRFAQVDSTNHPGIYEIQLANARFNVSGAKSLLVTISGASGAFDCDVTIPLRSVNPYDAVRMGMTAFPNVVTGNAGAVLVDGTGTAAITNSSGKVLLQATQTGVTIPTVTTVTNQLTSAAIATAIWQDLTASGDFTTNGSIGKLLVTDINAPIGSIPTTTPLTAAQIATGVWRDTTTGDFTVGGSIGQSLFTSGNVPGAANGLSLVGSNVTVNAFTAAGSLALNPNVLWANSNTGSDSNNGSVDNPTLTIGKAISLLNSNSDGVGVIYAVGTFNGESTSGLTIPAGCTIDFLGGSSLFASGGGGLNVPLFSLDGKCEIRNLTLDMNDCSGTDYSCLFTPTGYGARVTNVIVRANPFTVVLGTSGNGIQVEHLTMVDSTPTYAITGFVANSVFKDWSIRGSSGTTGEAQVHITNSDSGDIIFDRVHTPGNWTFDSGVSGVYAYDCSGGTWTDNSGHNLTANRYNWLPYDWQSQYQASVDSSGDVTFNNTSIGTWGTSPPAGFTTATFFNAVGTNTVIATDGSGRVLLQPNQSSVTIGTTINLTDLPSIPAGWITLAGLDPKCSQALLGFMTSSGVTSPTTAGVYVLSGYYGVDSCGAPTPYYYCTSVSQYLWNNGSGYTISAGPPGTNGASYWTNAASAGGIIGTYTGHGSATGTPAVVGKVVGLRPIDVERAILAAVTGVCTTSGDDPEIFATNDGIQRLSVQNDSSGDRTSVTIGTAD